jgi:hypothetical protein
VQNGGRITAVSLGICLALVGIALALAQLALPALGYELTPREGWVLLGLAALFFVGGVIALFSPWIKRAWSRLRRDAELTAAQPIGEDLRQHCCKLSAEISESYKHWRVDVEQAMQSEYADSLFYDSVGDQKRSELRDYHERGTVDLYREQYGSRVRNLSDKLAQRGLITPDEQQRFRNPTNPQDIQDIAEGLEAICRN